MIVAGACLPPFAKPGASNFAVSAASLDRAELALAEVMKCTAKERCFVELASPESSVEKIAVNRSRCSAARFSRTAVLGRLHPMEGLWEVKSSGCWEVGGRGSAFEVMRELTSKLWCLRKSRSGHRGIVRAVLKSGSPSRRALLSSIEFRRGRTSGQRNTAQGIESDGTEKRGRFRADCDDKER